MTVIDKVAIAITLNDKDLTSNLQKAQTNVLKFTQKMATTLGALFASSSLINFSKEIIQTGSDLELLSKSLGISAEKLEIFENLTKNFGGDATTMRSSLKSLNNQLIEAFRYGGETARTFNLLGIQITGSNGKLRNSTSVLTSLNRSFQNLNKQQQLYFGNKLGLDSSMIMLLQQSTSEFDNLIERQKKLGLISGDGVSKMSLQYSILTKELKQSFTALFVEISKSLLPILNFISSKLIDFNIWARENAVLFKSILISISIIVTAVLVPAFIALMASISPILLIFAGLVPILTAILLMVEDIKTYFEGGESYFGEFVNKFIKVKEILVAFFEGIKIYFKVLWSSFFEGFLENFNKIKGIFSSILDFFPNLKENLLLNTGNIYSPSGSALTSNNVNENISNRMNIQNLTVQTQASDAKGIGESITGELSKNWKGLFNINSGRRA